MKIGIIAEGHSDRAVLENILTGLTGLDSSNFVALRPSDLKDETDKAKNDPATFGSWTHVRTECQTKDLIDPFLSLDGHDFVTIQIDAAEANLYGIQKPNPKSKDYCKNLRGLVINQINIWLHEDLSNMILYAIAVEEIDAWVLTLYEAQDSSKYLNAKGRLKRIFLRNNIDSTSNYVNYSFLSRDFSKARSYRTSTYIDRNCSLAAFCFEVITKVVPKLTNSQEAQPEQEK